MLHTNNTKPRKKKLVVFAFWRVTLALLLLLTLANAQDDDANTTTTTTETSNEVADDDGDGVGLRLLFRYNTTEARIAAIALGLLGFELYHISEYNIGAIAVDSLDKLQKLRSLQGILSAEQDVNRDKLPYMKGRSTQKQLVQQQQEEEEAIMSRRHLQQGSQEEQPYGISLIQADQLWDIEPPAAADKKQINVCVVDTGYQSGHEDLPTRLGDGVDGTNTAPFPLLFGTWGIDGDGHGTHCAGIIGGIGDNGKGIVGVRKKPAEYKFHIGKGLSNGGTGYTTTILQAVHGCVENGAKVISMSLGGPYSSPIEEDYYEYLYRERGFLIIAAAGNEGNSEKSYPASYPAVMSVAAVDSNKNHADFSQYNDQVEIAGPGVDVLSTYPRNRYVKLSGTSMATPYVAGVAAAVWSHFPDCTNSQIRNVLLQTALDDESRGYSTRYGHGIVQAKAAYDLLQAEGCEAGGAAVPETAPVGGCLQHMDYVPANCTSGGAASLMLSSLSLFGWTCLSLVVGAASIYWLV